MKRLAAFVRPASLVLLVLVLPSLACSTLFPPRPPVEWSADPGNVVIWASTGGGMLYEPNPMPLARLRGDGQLIWVTFSGRRRRVLAGGLTTDQMRHLLQTMVDDGFFGWRANYSPGVVYDAPSTCLGVNLNSTSKTVCETLSGAPARFHDLLSLLGSGAGVTGTDYVPVRGYLKVTPLPEGAAPGGPQAVAWPSQQLGLRLAEVGQGQWIDGDALRLAWTVVNDDPLNPILQDGDADYQVQVLLPGVTEIEPPN